MNHCVRSGADLTSADDCSQAHKQGLDVEAAEQRVQEKSLEVQHLTRALVSRTCYFNVLPLSRAIFLTEGGRTFLGYSANQTTKRGNRQAKIGAN